MARQPETIVKTRQENGTQHNLWLAMALSSIVMM
jgi:hypothetical protein